MTDAVAVGEFALASAVAEHAVVSDFALIDAQPALVATVTAHTVHACPNLIFAALGRALARFVFALALAVVAERAVASALGQLVVSHAPDTFGFAAIFRLFAFLDDRAEALFAPPAVLAALRPQC